MSEDLKADSEVVRAAVRENERAMRFAKVAAQSGWGVAGRVLKLDATAGVLRKLQAENAKKRNAARSWIW